jgi:hypothetical protein
MTLSPPVFEGTGPDALELEVHSVPVMELVAPGRNELRSKRGRKSKSSELTPNEQQRRKLEIRMKDFNYKESAAWHQITSRFGSGLTQSELTCVAEVIANNLNLVVDREAKRRKMVLIRWFEENLTVIAPFLEKIRLLDSMGNMITNQAP